MNCMSKIALSLSLAIGMASGMFMDTAHAAPGGVASTRQEALTFFLADPELGVAGVYRANGKEIYFEARRAKDPLTGGPGELGLRVVDAQGRTLALGGTPETRWVPKNGEFTAADGGTDTQLLAGLSRALQSATLHAALSAEKSALADLAMQTGGTPAARLPVRAAVSSRRFAAAEIGQVASFYQGAARSVQVRRDASGALQASLGNGIVLQRTQQFVNEPDEAGRIGRVDAYSMVKASEGHVLIAEFGGDNVPDAWTADLDKAMPRDHTSLATDFGRAATALQALAYSSKVTKASTLSDPGERDALQRMAKSMVSNLLPERVDAAESAKMTASTSDYTIQAVYYQTSIEVWKQQLWNTWAQHSGTRVNRYWVSNGIRYFGSATHFCNHGACPYGSGMSRKCTYTGPYLTYIRQPTMNWGGGTCGTAYWAVGRPGHHNCHDDSSVQVRAVKGWWYSPWGGRCDDGWSGSIYAPNCDGY